MGITVGVAALGFSGVGTIDVTPVVGCDGGVADIVVGITVVVVLSMGVTVGVAALGVSGVGVVDGLARNIAVYALYKSDSIGCGKLWYAPSGVKTSPTLDDIMPWILLDEFRNSPPESLLTIRHVESYLWV